MTTTTAGPDTEQLLYMFRNMVTIREFEEAAGRLAEQAKIPGAVHLYAGEEAVAVGVWIPRGLGARVDAAVGIIGEPVAVFVDVCAIANFGGAWIDRSHGIVAVRVVVGIASGFVTGFCRRP